MARYCYDYPRPMVTVDYALFRVAEQSLEVLLVRRGSPPHAGRWALPGGFIRMKEPLEAAALRELAEETGVKDLPLLVQLGAYGDPGRDPRGRVISVAFIGVLPAARAKPRAGSDATSAEWHPVEALPDGLAFDHATILGDAVRRLAASGRTSGAIFAFLTSPFTLEKLRDVLYAVYGVELDPEEYLEPFFEARTMRQIGGGRVYRFTGWYEGKRR